jgi:hypothetical protein
MMDIEIRCPAAENVLVHVQGSGSGAPGTICVRGIVVGFQVGDKLLTAGLMVLVRILSGSDGLGSFGSPGSSQSGDRLVSVNGSDWCLPDLQVPSYSDAGDPMTVAAWLVTPGSPSPTFGPGQTAQFNASTNASSTDCCSGCISGSGMMPFIAELMSMPDLDVTVADGANAGTYKATAVGAFRWRVAVGKAAYLLYVCGSNLVIDGPAGTAASTAVVGNPFSAVFPGAIFLATNDIVVTLA